MKKLFALLVVMLALSSGVRAQNFDFPSSPTVGEIVTGPGGQQFQWDGTRWVVTGVAGSAAPLHNPPSGQNNYAPLSSPTFTGAVEAPQLTLTSTATTESGNAGALTVTGSSTLGTTSMSIANITSAIISDVLQIPPSGRIVFNGVPVGGACPAGEFVNALSTTLVPTCAAAGGGGGGGPFLPEDNPTYTGLMTGPTLNLSVESGSPSITMAGTPTAPIAMMRGYSIAGGGSDWTTGGVPTTVWTATLPQAEQISESGGSIGFSINTGLTVGTPYAPTGIASLSPAGFNLMSGGLGVGITPNAAYPFYAEYNTTAQTGIYLRQMNTTANANGAAIQFYNGTGGSFTTIGLNGQNATGYAASRPPNATYIQAGSSTAGISISTSYSQPIDFWSGGFQIVRLTTAGLNLITGQYMRNGVPFLAEGGVRDSPPDKPTPGELYYDSTVHKLRVFTTAWETVQSSP